MKKLLGVILEVLLVVSSIFTEILGLCAIYALTKTGWSIISFVGTVIFSFVLMYYIIKLKRKIDRKFLY